MAFKQPPAASGWPPWTLLASEPDRESTLKHCQTADNLTILQSFCLCMAGRRAMSPQLWNSVKIYINSNTVAVVEKMYP